MTLPALRRQIGKFERVVAKNAEQRGKFPDDPSKWVFSFAVSVRYVNVGMKTDNRFPFYRFIESEADLDAGLKQFLPLTQNPPMFYPELVKAGATALLANLLSHENTDIAIDVIEIIRELTDEDVGAEVDDLAEEDENEAEGSSGAGGGGGIATKTRMAMGELIDDLVRPHPSVYPPPPDGSEVVLTARV